MMLKWVNYCLEVFKQQYFSVLTMSIVESRFFWFCREKETDKSSLMLD